MRTILFLLLTLLLYTGCKKHDLQHNEFDITGIKDVDMRAPFGNELPLTVMVSSGVPETVSLSATGLPAGMSVTFNPAIGLPGFSTTATFSGSASGTFPIRIIGTSASSTKTYEVNLIGRPMNGWRFDGIAYDMGAMTRTNGASSTSINIFPVSGNQQLIITKPGSFPTADGVYTYPIGGAGTNPDRLNILYVDGSFKAYHSTDRGTSAVTLVVAAGKISVTLPATLVNGGDDKELSIDLHQ